MLVPHGALILVIDGGALRLFRNRGTETSPHLDLVESRKAELNAAHAFGGGRPVRVFESVGPAHHAVEGPDLRRRRDEEFAALACTLVAAHEATDHPVIVVAPPRMLGVLRTLYSRDLHQQLAAEIGKDWTHQQPDEIARLLQHHRD